MIGAVVAVAAVTVAIWAIAGSLARQTKIAGTGRPASAAPTAKGNRASPPADREGTAPGSAAGEPSSVSLGLPTSGELTWTYLETAGASGNPTRVTETLGGAFNLGGQAVARLASTDPSRPALLARLRNDGLAVYGRMAPDGRAPELLFTPPYRLLPQPLPLGAPLTQDFSVQARDVQGSPTSGSGRLTLNVGARSEKRTVPAGEFTAYPFQLVEEIAGPAMGVFRVERSGWLAPGAGIIEEQLAATRGGDRRVVNRVLESKSF
jgi:hypothetical protein